MAGWLGGPPGLKELRKEGKSLAESQSGVPQGLKAAFFLRHLRHD
jgi:hypothetical protein